jgi:signal transduction histidine kinase
MMSRIAIENAHRQLQELSKRVLQVQEEERRTISSELHDDIGQSLGALKIGLHRMARDPGADHAGLLGECLATADAVLEKLRNVAHELRPPQLDQLGLGAALEWLAERQRRTTGLAIECRASGLERRRAPAAVESACYRIAQESMNNAARHANASTIRIAVECDGQLLKLCLQDDGVGFDAEAARSLAAKGASVGLIGMEERARLAGGRVKVRTVQGAGTTVTAIFPLDSRAAGAFPDEPCSTASP